MDLEILGFNSYKLATEEVVDLPVFLGVVSIADKLVNTCFIPGDYLLGMEFLAKAGEILVLDLKHNRVELE